jgi:DNA polymerase III subunit gamma/tau
VSAPSLYRRHRPRTFADVVGQEHVVRTLSNAVEQGKVHHANLFVGSRGTGKTSMAKILAACLNCEKGPTTTPCGVCESCVSIASATSMDVIEMDAASNNSVDDIRDLREKVAYAPVSGRHKVYILDEAHMLSQQAWNAFLKTLEEPPPHTIFVLATTEANKVLPTVVDRCHRFDFKRPNAEQVAGVVRRVAEAEHVEIGPEAVALLARHATGSFRDALGTLEQLVTYSGSSIALDDVLAVLGVADADLLFGAFDAIASGDPRAALLAADRLNESGRDASQFLRDLEGHARDLLVVGTLGGDVPRELSISPERDARLTEQAARVPRGAVVRLLELLAAALEAIKAGADPRTQLELALVKAASPAVDSSTRALLARIEQLEAALAGGRAEVAPEPVVARAEPEGGQAPAVPPPAAPQPEMGQAPAVQAPAAPASGGQAPAVEGANGGDLEGMRELWPAVVEDVRAHSGRAAAALEHARPVEVRGGELVIAFAPGQEFLAGQVRSADCNALVADAVRTVTGTALRPAYEFRELDVPAAPTEDEWIDRFKTAFDAEEISSEEPDA